MRTYMETERRKQTNPILVYISATRNRVAKHVSCIWNVCELLTSALSTC